MLYLNGLNSGGDCETRHDRRERCAYDTSG